MGGKPNYPTQQLAELSGSDFVSDTVNSLMDLRAEGIPRTDQELQQRVDQYFQFCEERALRPGIESLSLSLGTTRRSFWQWCNGQGSKSREWQRICLEAKQIIICFLEQAGLTGKINPAVLIFGLKNWAGYKDNTVELAEAEGAGNDVLKAEDLPRLGNVVENVDG